MTLPHRTAAFGQPDTSAGASTETTPRLWPLLTVFAVAYFFFISAPSIFHRQFPLREGMEWGDALDIATPFVVLTLAWVIVWRSTKEFHATMVLPLLLIAIAWTQGQGMHLAANSISNQTEGATGSVPDLVHFYDEQLSHVIWHVGIISLLCGFLVLGARNAPSGSEPRFPWQVLPAVLVFGTIVALDAIESAVIPLALPPFTLLTAAGVYLYARRPRAGELFAFTVASLFVASAIILGWGVYHGGWPELSEVGLI